MEELNVFNTKINETITNQTVPFSVRNVNAKYRMQIDELKVEKKIFLFCLLNKSKINNITGV